MTLYRGCNIVYSGINLGFVSTSIKLSVAKNFSGLHGIVYELNISPNIPYIDINIWNNFEYEILLPRGLTFTIKSYKKKYYIVDVNL